MKKISVLFAVLAVSFTAFAGNDKPISEDKLPAAAREFIAGHFSGVKISLATVDKELLDTTYEVFFTNGDKVEFDKKGQWKDIDCKYSRVPENAIPEEISRYVSTHHQGLYVKEIDRDKRDYEVKLNNGLELKFDLRFRLIGYDD